MWAPEDASPTGYRRIAAEAAKRLKVAGFAPRSVVGDGLAGWPGRRTTRFGLTVATDGKQSLWLDNAAHAVG
ncbi:hypothetical protein ACWC0A_15545 [Streptomyces scopuliridis]